VLSRALAADRVAHAYLFSGPAHTGKTLTALQFAQALNCTGEGAPCGRCRPCERIASGIHPDVEIVSVGGMCDERDHDHADSRDIRVCQVRRMESVVSRAPFEGRYRVQIIDPASAMNEIAQNALLKTLEEPPPHVVIVLVTDTEDVLLETIRSRVRRVPFGGMPKDAIERALRTRWDVDPGRAASLARLSGGRIGWAVLAIHDEKLTERQEGELATAAELAEGRLADRLAWASETGGRWSKDRPRVRATLDVWERCWRDILLIAAGREDQAVHREQLDTLHALAAQCDVASAVRALRAIGEARQQLEENASPVLALEVMVMALPRLRPNAVAGRLAGR
jgi:DNA polymerase-3 subunit delta'